MPKPKINPKNKKGPVYTLPPRQLYRASTWKKREPGPRGNFSPYKQGLFFLGLGPIFWGLRLGFVLVEYSAGQKYRWFLFWSYPLLFALR